MVIAEDVSTFLQQNICYDDYDDGTNMKLFLQSTAPRAHQTQCASLGRDIANNFDDDQVSGAFLDNLVQL